MPDSLNILLVEDNRSISAAYKSFFESEGNTVVCAYDSDSAIRLLNENPSFGFDLLFTDIDLVGDPTKGADKSGISFACYAHKVLPNIPVVGHSAYFDNDDISTEERACFDEWFPKGIKTAEREAMFDKALALAKQKRKARVGQLTMDDLTAFSDSLSVPSSSNDFEQLGYVRDIIEPNDSNGFVQPFSVWRRNSEDGCELEVEGFPALLAWGDDKEEAYDHLFDFIHSNKDLATLPNTQLGGSSLLIAKFIRQVVGENEVDQ